MTDSRDERRIRLSRRAFLRLSGSAAGLATLAACVPGGGAAPAPTVAPAAPAAGGAAAEPVSQVTGEIVVAIMGENLVEEAMNLVSEGFNELYPGVTVIWDNPNLGAGDYPQWLGTQIAAGNIYPDVVSGNYLSSYGGYVNLDQYRRTTNPFTGNPWDEDIAWDLLRGKNNKGERIMIHMRSVHTFYFYNQEIFEEVGVEPPADWEQFVDIAGKLADAGYAPLSINYVWQAPQWLAEIYFDQYHVDWVETVRAQPGDWNYEPDKDGAFEYDPLDPFIHEKYTYNVQRFYNGILEGELRFDTSEVAELAANMARIFPQYAVENFFVITDPYPPFLQKQAAIMSNGTWALPALLQDMEAISPERLEELGIEATDITPFAWQTFENPSMVGDLVKTSAKAVESAPGPYFSIINKNQEQVDRALPFVMFISTAPGFSLWNEGLIQANRFTPAGPLLINNLEDPPEIQAVWDQLEFTGNAETNYNGFWTSDNGGDFQTDLRNMLKEVLEEQVTPEQYAEGLQGYITDNLEGILQRIDLTLEDIQNPARQPGT